MKIVVAPDSFKEALGAAQAAEAIAAGLRAARPDAEVIQVPMADGGEGTMEVLVGASDGEYREVTVTGPLGNAVRARFGLIDGGKTAVVEMAQASGLQRIPPERRDPTRTSTRGTGELIRAALDANVAKIIVGIGGSATVDGGAGMASALGVSLLDFENASAGLCGGDVGDILQVDLAGLDPRVKRTQIVVASDVTNPLLGESGAARVYGPQKGATPEQVEMLEQNLEVLCGLLETASGRELRNIAGAGAAGGLGMGLVGFLGARIESGFDLVAEAVGLAAALHGADLVITGEGSIDRQTLQGKVVFGVGKLAAEAGVRAVALTGLRGDGADALAQAGIGEVIQITPEGIAHAQALSDCAANLQQAARKIIAE